MEVLKLLLILSGGLLTAPVPTSHTSYQNKCSFVGVLLFLVHLVMGVYCVYRSEAATADDPQTYKEQNNIMRAIVAMGRFISIVLQPGLAVSCYLQRQQVCVFLRLCDELDEYLSECRVKVEQFQRKTIVLDRIVAGVTLLALGLNFLVIYFLFTIYYEKVADVYDLYTSLLPIISFLVNSLLTWCFLYALLIRMKAYNRVLKEFFKDCHRREVEKGYLRARERGLLLK